MLNQTVLTGNLGADPEMFYSSEGKPVASFNIAFKAGKKKTGWIKVAAFNRLAEICEKYLHKGARIGIMGTLDQQKWETDEGCYQKLISDPGQFPGVHQNRWEGI